MPRGSKTFLYVECDTELPFDRKADPALEISETSTGVDGWSRLSTRFRIDDSPPREDLTTFKLFHQEIGLQWEAEEPDSYHEIERRHVRVPRFAMHRRQDSGMYFQCPRVVVQRILRRLRESSHNPLFVFRTRQVNLQQLEDRIKRQAGSVVDIKGYTLTNFILDGVVKARVEGNHLDQVEYVNLLTNRSTKEGVKFDIESGLGNARITVHESGEIVMGRDIGIGPMLDFVDWLDAEIKECSQLSAMKVKNR